MAQARKKAKRKPIPRQTRHFQLRKNHPVDTHVSEILDFARAQRREVTVIRDGVRLLWALENNDLSVLFEMFPHLKPQIGGGGAGGSELREIRSMLEIVVAGRKSNEMIMQSALPSTGQQIAGFKALAAPVDDDDLPALVIKESTGNTGTMNFLNSLAGIGITKSAAPPKAVAQKAREASADEIADNFLGQFT